jgi:prolipoprotein diacylglyceryltransferase
MFFFARLFHMLSDWVNEKFILMDLLDGNFLEFLRYFFTPPDYLFSLFGAVFGFFIVFFSKTHHAQKDRLRYLEAIVSAFLFASILGYSATLLGGQVYGIPFSSPLSITYDHADAIVKDRAALFPLPVFYILGIIAIIFGIRKLRAKGRFPDGFLALVGIGTYSLLLFFWEFLSGSRKDIFYDLTLSLFGGVLGLSLNQIGAIIGIIIATLWILRLTERKI